MEKNTTFPPGRMIRDNFKVKIWILLALFTLVFSNIVAAQDAKEDETIKIDTLLVNIPVIASDRDGRYVAGLKKEDFFIVEDGVNRNVDFFADNQAPMNAAILIDASFSTRDVLGEITQAARDFIKTLRPEDKCMIASFDAETNILADFTSDQKKLNKAVKRVGISPRVGSNMQDAMYRLVTKNFAAVRGRKTIIVLTDGSVRGRDISNLKLVDTLIESDVIIYPILFNAERILPPNFRLPQKIKLPTGETINADEFRKRIQAAHTNELLFMKLLGVITGGRTYENIAEDFQKIFQNIADELKKQYVVGFYPSSISDGKPHKIVVKTNSIDTVIRTKSVIRLKSAQ